MDHEQQKQPSPSGGRFGWGSDKARSLAKQLRKNPTDAERALWQHIRKRQIEGFRFRRQQPIGPYVVDFVCFEARLAIEVDGGQHADNQVYDQRRTARLNARGFQVLRFWNNEVLTELEGVKERIRETLLSRGTEV